LVSIPTPPPTQQLFHASLLRRKDLLPLLTKEVTHLTARAVEHLHVETLLASMVVPSITGAAAWMTLEEAQQTLQEATVKLVLTIQQVSTKMGTTVNTTVSTTVNTSVNTSVNTVEEEEDNDHTSSSSLLLHSTLEMARQVVQLRTLAKEQEWETLVVVATALSNGSLLPHHIAMEVEQTIQHAELQLACRVVLKACEQVVKEEEKEKEKETETTELTETMETTETTEQGMVVLKKAMEVGQANHSLLGVLSRVLYRLVDSKRNHSYRDLSSTTVNTAYEVLDRK
jgi:hypothetical protein